MTEDQFNKFFRDKLSKYPSPVPNNMWRRIQSKKKRRFLFWWFFGGILLASFVTGYLIYQNRTNNYNNKDFVSFEKQKTQSENNTGSEGTDHSVKNKTLEREKVSDQNDESDTLKSSTKIITDVPESAAKGTSVKGNLIRNYPEHNAPNTIGKNPYNLEDGKSQLTEKKPKSSIITNTSPQNNTQNEADSLAPIDKSQQKAAIKNDSTTTINKVVPALLSKDSSKDQVAVKKDTRSQKSKKNVKQKNFFLTGYFSPALALNKFTSDNSSYPLSYLNRVYKMKFSYTAGVGIGKMFSKRFSIQTGLLYSQVNMILQTIDSAIFKIKGKYRNIDVPIIAGYNIGHSDLSTTIHAGILFNLSATSQGSSVYDSIGNPVDIYRTSTGISLYFGLSFSKQLTNKVNLFAEPFFIYRPSYITKQKIAFQQQINMTGISFGLRYNF